MKTWRAITALGFVALTIAGNIWMALRISHFSSPEATPPWLDHWFAAGWLVVVLGGLGMAVTWLITGALRRSPPPTSPDKD